MKLFKSKAEKELEARMAVRQGINELRKCDRSLEKKKAEMIKNAQEAKYQGISDQYAVAVSGLKMIMGYQKRCQAMILQLQMTDTMRDLTIMNSKFVGLMGKVGSEVSKVTSSTRYVKNQMAFEKGMLASETAMEQLEDFLESSGMAFSQQNEESLDMEIERLIDQTSAGEVNAMDKEIDRRLAELEGKGASIKENS